MKEKYISYYDDPMLEKQEIKILTEKEEILKKFNTKSINDPKIYAPVGHIYSIIVEELNIENPNINDFICTFNKYIENTGDYHAVIKDATNNLTNRTIHPLSSLLEDMIERKEMNMEKYDFIIKEASGGQF